MPLSLDITAAARISHRNTGVGRPTTTVRNGIADAPGAATRPVSPWGTGVVR